MQLTDGQKAIGRRNFLKAAGALPAAGAFAYAATNTGPVKTGIIGTGMEGRILLSVTDPKYLYVTAMCDIRPDNQILGREMIQSQHGADPRVYERYQDLLADPDIEAVMIATPLKLHGPMAIDAFKAGKHVFVEKTMAYSLDECLEMTRLAARNNLNLQIGHQRFYNPLYWDALRMVQEGLLGNVYHVRALWHRNSDWNYWIHVQDEYRDAVENFKPEPYGYPDIQHLVNWRWYEATSHGLWTELCSHQIAITNWIFGDGERDAAPTAVMASGGNCKTNADQNELYLKLKSEYDERQDTKYKDFPTFESLRRHKQGYDSDDRNIPDHIYAIFEYPEGKTVTYSAIQSSSVDKYYEQIMGTRGTIILSNENETYLFWEPGWDEETSSEVNASQKATQITITQESKAQSAFAAHVSEEAKGSGGASDMSPFEPYRYELQGFAHTIRQGAPNLCDGRRAALAAQACLYGKQALESKSRLEIPELLV